MNARGDSEVASLVFMLFCVINNYKCLFRMRFLIGRTISSCQIDGWNMIKSGNNSNRPASISKINTHLDKSVKCAKFCVGPTMDKPGPMLFIVAITEVKLVTKSFSSNATIRIEKIKSAAKVIK